MGVGWEPPVVGCAAVVGGVVDVVVGVVMGSVVVGVVEVVVVVVVVGVLADGDGLGSAVTSAVAAVTEGDDARGGSSEVHAAVATRTSTVVHTREPVTRRADRPRVETDGDHDRGLITEP